MRAITTLTKLIDSGRYEGDKLISAHLVLQQLKTKMARQEANVKATAFQIAMASDLPKTDTKKR